MPKGQVHVGTRVKAHGVTHASQGTPFVRLHKSSLAKEDMSLLAREDTSPLLLVQGKTCLRSHEKSCLLLQENTCQEKTGPLLHEKTCPLLQEKTCPLFFTRKHLFSCRSTFRLLLKEGMTSRSPFGPGYVTTCRALRKRRT